LVTKTLKKLQSNLKIVAAFWTPKTLTVWLPLFGKHSLKSKTQNPKHKTLGKSRNKSEPFLLFAFSISYQQPVPPPPIMHYIALSKPQLITHPVAQSQACPTKQKQRSKREMRPMSFPLLLKKILPQRTRQSGVLLRRQWTLGFYWLRNSQVTPLRVGSNWPFGVL
jgi:hypothetical protein